MAFKERRSIRKYSQQQIPTKVLLEILEAASWAPSAHNAQPWRFIVITQPGKKRSLAEAMAKPWLRDLKRDGEPMEARTATAEDSVERFSNAPALVVACSTMENMRRYPDKKRQKSERDLAVQSLGAAIQSLLLAAHGEQLGACWYCAPAFCKDAVKRELKIPREVEPQALIAIGHPAEKPNPPKRKSLDTFVFSQRWGGKL